MDITVHSSEYGDERRRSAVVTVRNTGEQPVTHVWVTAHADTWRYVARGDDLEPDGTTSVRVGLPTHRERRAITITVTHRDPTGERRSDSTRLRGF